MTVVEVAFLYFAGLCASQMVRWPGSLSGKAIAVRMFNE